MPIPYRTTARTADGTTAAYLCILEDADGKSVRGALFLTNERSEPLDFCFNRVDLPASFLWRPGEARRHGARALATSLFTAIGPTPDALLVHRDQVPAGLFTADIQVEIPTCTLASRGDQVDVSWVGGQPAGGSVARILLDALVERGLVMEPFERAARGLDEVYSAP